MIMEKRCSKCKKIKPIEDFCKVKSGKLGRHHYCRNCLSLSHKKSYRSNKDKYRNNYVQWKYGLSVGEYNALLTQQEDKCAICGNHFKSKRTTLIDHCHASGKIRGLLCPSCNNLLGASKDNIHILEQAINYLKGEIFA